MKNGEYTINKEVIKDLEENFRFTDRINFKDYDYLTVRKNELEFFAEAEYKQDDYGAYNKVADPKMVICKKDNLSGCYVPTYFK